jgi:FAD/FMN-containing dehydrogenase
MSAVVTAPASADAAYLRRRERLRDQYAAIPAGVPVRLAKRTSNLFRQRTGTPAAGLDVAAFDGVLSIDPAGRTADVQGMTTYEHLVDATLAHGLMPLVVPELKTITLGGAVTGLGIESTSFRNGLPHEAVLELEVMTGDGRIVVARRDNEHAGLFRGFPNSYGTLGYALRLQIELEPVRPFVRLRHVFIPDANDYFAAVDETCATRTWQGEPVDFLDGTVFARGAHFLTLGAFTDEAPYTSDYTGQQIYYRSIHKRAEDYLTIRDYLWRWDTDWFWCSRAFGTQRPRLRRVWPRRWLRSDFYWKLVSFGRRHGIRQDGEPVIQDIEVPVDRAAEFLDVFHREVGLAPIWMCPLRVREEGWALYPLDADTTYVNFGFWGMVARRPGERDGDRNRLIEHVVSDLGGRKSLYSTSYYSEDEFRALYGGADYERLKREYDPGGRLLDLYDKCAKGR